MKNLGEKIKYLRIKKGLSQSNLSMDPDNNSGISQIESGHNKSPRKELIFWIAKKLDMTYDELIKDTDYSPGTVKSGLIAVSDSDFEVKIEDKYNFTIKRNYYPRYNNDGTENKYCPRYGTLLISNCKNCSKPIRSMDDTFCMGCGNILFNDFRFINQRHLSFIWKNEDRRKDLISSAYDFWLSEENIDEDDIDCILEAIDSNRNRPIIDSYYEDGKKELYDEEWVGIVIEHIFGDEINRKKFYTPKYKEITKSEFYLGSRSNFKEVVEFSNDLISKINFIEKYCLEVEKILNNEDKGEADVKLQDN